AISPADPNVLYAGVGLYDQRGQRSALFVSSDRGATWREAPGSPDYCYSQCNYTNVVAPHPTDASTVYLGGGLCAVWRVQGALGMTPTYAAISMPNNNCARDFSNWYLHRVHPDTHDIVFDPRAP